MILWFSSFRNSHSECNIVSMHFTDAYQLISLSEKLNGAFHFNTLLKCTLELTYYYASSKHLNLLHVNNKMALLAYSTLIIVWACLCDFGTYTTLTNFSTKYLMMCKVYSDVGCIK